MPGAEHYTNHLVQYNNSRTPAACHSAFGAKPPAAARHDDATTRRAPQGRAYGQTRRITKATKSTKARPRKRLGQVLGASSQLPASLSACTKTINGSPPLAARRPWQAGVAGVRVGRITSGHSDEPAVCNSLDSHSCHRAKRGAASGQKSVEVTHKAFLVALRALGVSLLNVVSSRRRRVVAASVPKASAASVDKQLSQEKRAMTCIDPTSAATLRDSRRHPE